MAKQHNVPFRLYRRGEVFHAYISFISQDGIRVQLRETTGATTESQATEYCVKRIQEIQAKSRQDANGELPIITIDDAFGRYFYEKGQYNSRPQQTLTRLETIKKIINVQYLHEINESVITDFIRQQRSIISNSTINRYLALISVILNTASYEWHVKTATIRIGKLKLKEPAENIKYIKDWQTAQKIIDRADKHLKIVIYIALYTGMRLGNILNLKWENLDFISNTITIKVKDRTKEGGKNLTIPMIAKLAEILQAQPKINEYVINYRKKPIKSIMSSWRNIFYYRNEKGVFTKRLKDETLPYINFHTLRHTAATWILKKTNNLRITKEILGHSDIKTTMKYAHVLDEEKRRALDTVFE